MTLLLQRICTRKEPRLASDGKWCVFLKKYDARNGLKGLAMKTQAAVSL